MNGLKHLVYFEALSQTEENTQAWHTTTAGLVILRMLDTWDVLGKWSLQQNQRGIANMRKEVNKIDEGNPIRKILHGLMDSIENAKHPDKSTILPRLMAYGRALDYEGRYRLSKDVYDTVLGYAEEPRDSDIVIDAHMQIGYCNRMLAQWEDAAEAYALAGQLASARGDEERVLRARIADAKLAIDRGNLPEAELLLDATIDQAYGTPALNEVLGLALHERAAVSYLRGKFEDSVQLGYEALQVIQNPMSRDRVLSDIAAAFAELGVLTAARDALIIVASTAQELYVKWAAEINLLEVAAKLNEETGFESHRRSLASVNLPPSLKAHYHLYVGRGYQLFGRSEQARAELNLALSLSTEHRFNQIVFEAERSLEELDRGTLVTELVTLEPGTELADIAAAIRGLREELVPR